MIGKATKILEPERPESSAESDWVDDLKDWGGFFFCVQLEYEYTTSILSVRAQLPRMEVVYIDRYGTWGSERGRADVCGEVHVL